jgi:hypothetical protein
VGIIRCSAAEIVRRLAFAGGSSELLAAVVAFGVFLGSSSALLTGMVSGGLAA